MSETFIHDTAKEREYYQHFLQFGREHPSEEQCLLNEQGGVEPDDAYKLAVEIDESTTLPSTCSIRG